MCIIQFGRCTHGTSKICNTGVCSWSRRRQIANIDFVKKNIKQSATTIKSDPHQPPWTTPHANNRRGGRRCRWLSNGWRRGLQRTPWRPGVRHDHCDTELQLVLFACSALTAWRHSVLSPTGLVFGIFQEANDHRWDNYRRSGLCQRAMHVWDVRSCMLSYSDSLRPSAPLSGYIISAANAIPQHLTHVTSD